MRVVYVPCSNKACDQQIPFRDGDQPDGQTFCSYCVNGVAAPTMDRLRFQEYQFDTDIPRGSEYIDVPGGTKINAQAPDIDGEGEDAK
jgi:hypothetical protein